MATPFKLVGAACPMPSMASLYNKKNLGVHTELLSDGLVELIKAGVIDNSRKNH